MRESEIEYRTLVEQVPAIIYTARLDEIGSTFYVSKRIEQLGFSQAEWLEDPALWSKQLHPDDRERVLAEYTRAYTKGEPFRSEYRLLARDGRVVWFRDESVIVRDSTGQPLYLQGVMMDITEHKMAMAERDRLFNLSIDMLCVAGFDGFFKQINPSWGRVLGWSETELLGSPWLDFVHPNDRDRTVQALTQLSAGEPVYDFENRYRCKDGSYRWISWTTFPLPAEQLTFAVARDITERKRAEEAIKESEKLLRKVIDSLGPYMFVGLLTPDGTVHWVMGRGEFTYAEDGQPLRMRGVVVETTERKLMEERMVRERDFSEAMINSLPGIFYLYDDTQKFLRWNKNFEHVSGYSADEIAGMSPLDFFTGDERRLIEEKIQEVLTNGESSAEANFVSKDGRRTPYYFTGLRIEIDNKPCLIGMGIDITDRKLAEEALERAYGELEERVDERTRELTEANIKLKELDRLKAEFLATMSHELRTPLNSIIGFTGMILQGMAGEINEEQKKQLSMVYNSAKHLLSLINDILDLSRIESGKVDVSMSEFKVDEVISEVVRSLDPMVSQKGLRLITEIPDEIPEIWSDRKKFFQILLNLVNNAVKFTDRGEIKIACKTDNNNLEVSVSDTGIGIKKENMDLLFEAFRQVDGSSRRRYEGTGLGLYLCKKLLDLLGGRIWVESEYGKGSRFTFTLPLGPKVRE